MSNIVYYLFIAVRLFNGVPDITFAYPYPSIEACAQGKVLAEATLTTEMKTPDPKNAASYWVECKAVTLSQPEHRIPSKDEA